LQEEYYENKKESIYSKNREKLVVNTEDNHNIPNGNLFMFNTTTHKDQAKRQNQKKGDESLRHSKYEVSMEGHYKIPHKQGNMKSAERRPQNQVQVSDDECEVDLLSNSDQEISEMSKQRLVK